MTDFGLAAYRLVLRCYPKDFRQHYSDEMTQLFHDRRAHDHTSTSRILAREVTDAAVAATTMRLRSTMSKIVWTAVAMTVAIVATVVVGPIFLPALAIVALVGTQAVRRSRLDQPLDRSRRWVAWAVAGAVAITPGVVILATSDEELTELLWSLMALSMVTGFILLVIGIALAIARPRSAPATA